jgi:hypothetical protein
MAILKWFAKKATSPLSNLKLDLKKIIPNLALKNIMGVIDNKVSMFEKNY